MALPFVGVGLLYRKGYFRQTIDADGHQEHDYPDYDLTPAAARPGPGRDGAAADGHRRAARARPDGRRLARPGRARPGPAARHGPARERRRRPADHPHPVRPRPRDAPPPGARPGRRRRARDPRARPRARRSGTSTRATPRSCSPSGPASSSPPATTLDDGLGRRSGATACSRSTRRSRPATSASRRTSSGASPGRCSTATAACPVERVLELGLGRGRRPRPVRHDRVLAAPDQRRQRGQPAPRRDRQRDVAGVIDRQPILGITNGIHGPTWIGDADRASCSSATSDADLDDLDASTEPGPLLGAHRADPGRRDLWEAHLRQKRELAHLRARPAAQPVRPPRRGAVGPRRARDGARPGRS